MTVAEGAVRKTLKPISVTSREASKDIQVPVMTVSGTEVREKLPWLHALYHGLFRELAQLGNHELVFAAKNDLYGAVLNVQRGAQMRYECHVDSNPIEALLYVTDHPKGDGGELAVANNPEASCIEEVEVDASVVYPVSGNLILFDARRFPHYVRPLSDPSAIRVVVAMNYYTPSCSENMRPADLDRHLFGFSD